MSFEEECRYGFKKYEKHFNKICEQSSSFLGHITHCSIVQVYLNQDSDKLGAWYRI